MLNTSGIRVGDELKIFLPREPRNSSKKPMVGRAVVREIVDSEKGIFVVGISRVVEGRCVVRDFAIGKQRIVGIHT